MSDSISKILFDRKSAAYVLSISTRALDYLIANGQLTTIRLGKKVMIHKKVLDKFSATSHAALTQAPA